ncbi:MAG: hypothetical protein ACPG4Q_04565 [Phycisphaeraceae bacterium]
MKQIKINCYVERFIALTLPFDGRMCVCDHDEVFEIDLGTGVANYISDDPYDFCEKNKTYGLSEAPPIKQTGDKSLSYDFDPYKKHVDVFVTLGSERETIKFPIMSGDWFFASFSECGLYLVIAEPYELHVYKLSV